MSIFKKTKEVSMLEVGLLVDDQALARELSSIFKEINIIPQNFRDLSEMWPQVIEAMPNLLIIDVKKMNEGGKFLKNHPLVISGELNIAFVASQAEAPLLLSTYDIFNYGVILKEQNLRGQIKSVLKRLNKFNDWFSEKKVFEKNESQFSRLVSFNQQLKETNYYSDLLKKVTTRFSQIDFNVDFFESCEEILSQLEDVEAFAFVEIAPNGKKTISPLLSSNKYKIIPQLWLGENNTIETGIKEASQQLITQTAQDVLEERFVTLKIKNQKQAPQKLIFIKLLDEEMMLKFDWKYFEFVLSGVNAQFTNVTQVNEKSERILSSWSLLNLLDDHFYGTLNGKSSIQDDIYLINFDFSPIVDVVRSKVGQRFYWRNFYNEFIAKLISSFKAEYRMSYFGPYHVSFVIEKEAAQEFFNLAKSQSKRFPYWRYFENIDIVLARSLNPEVRMIPLSSEAYLSFVEEGKVVYARPELNEKLNNSFNAKVISEVAFDEAKDVVTVNQRKLERLIEQ